MSKEKMIVVGSGAAGMMAAIKASEKFDVIVLEKNNISGKKLFITGKGRCNITNDSDENEFLKHVVQNPKFLYTAITEYNSKNVIHDFENWGLALKTERGNRVFPQSDHSSDVIHILEHEMKKHFVKILYNEEVKDIITEPYKSEKSKDLTVEKVIGIKDQNGKIFKCDVIVIATGGLSYPSTGSTGDGYGMLMRHGINVIKPQPSLAAFEIKDSSVKEMMGLSLKNVKISMTARKESFEKLKKDKVIYEEQGEMLFTHFGVSGPLILSASSYLNSYLRKEKKELENNQFFISIDLKPALSNEQLNERIQRDLHKYENREFQNSLSELLPRLMIPVIIKKSEIDPWKKVNQISHEERMRLLYILKNLTFDICGIRGFDESIITSGGVDVKELDPKTMETKKVKGLRCAGEVIDCDALTGGFNLQIAWSTANLAAK